MSHYPQNKAVEVIDAQLVHVIWTCGYSAYSLAKAQLYTFFVSLFVWWHFILSLTNMKLLPSKPIKFYESDVSRI